MGNNTTVLGATGTKKNINAKYLVTFMDYFSPTEFFKIYLKAKIIKP